MFTVCSKGSVKGTLEMVAFPRNDVILMTLFTVCSRGSVKATLEVVASPEVSLQDVQRKLNTLPSNQVRFEGQLRLFANASSLVTHGGCHVLPSVSIVSSNCRVNNDELVSWCFKPSQPQRITSGLEQ